jgi:hypothetical protein
MSRVDLSPTEITTLIKVGACEDEVPGSKSRVSGDSGESSTLNFEPGILNSEDGLLSIAPLHGSLGEPLRAYQEPKLNRKQMVWLLPSLLTLTGRKSSARRAGRRPYINWSQATGSDGPGVQMMIGDLIEQAVTPKILGATALHIEVPGLNDYTAVEKLRLEREALGFALSHNEMEIIEVGAKGVVPSGELHCHADRKVKVAGVIVAGRRHTAKEGGPMLFFSLQDREGLIEVVLFPDAYKANRAALSRGGHGPYMVSGHVQVSGKGRAIGVQPPPNLRPTDILTIKMHPVLIADDVQIIDNNGDRK